MATEITVEHAKEVTVYLLETLEEFFIEFFEESSEYAETKKGTFDDDTWARTNIPIVLGIAKEFLVGYENKSNDDSRRIILQSVWQSMDLIDSIYERQYAFPTDAEPGYWCWSPERNGVDLGNGKYGIYQSEAEVDNYYTRCLALGLPTVPKNQLQFNYSLI